MKGVNVLNLRRAFSRSNGREARSRAGAGEARNRVGAWQGQEQGRGTLGEGTGAGVEAGEARSQAGARHRAPESQLNRLREFPIA